MQKHVPPAFPEHEAQVAVKAALREDEVLHDITSKSLFTEKDKAYAVIVCKENGVLAGMKAAELAFRLCDKRIKFKHHVKDGAKIKKGSILAAVSGHAIGILAGERVSLNFLQHLSGIATQTHAFALKLKGLKAKLLDTRKTTPGLRALEKYAVSCGGGVNHRFSLSDGILIKDNHIQIAGDIKECVRRAKKTGYVIEVEVDTLKQLREILSLDELPDIVMLDNMSLKALREAVKLCRRVCRQAGGKIRLEASGNVTLDSIRDIAMTGVDYISSGALTHSAKALDISLDIVP